MIQLTVVCLGITDLSNSPTQRVVRANLVATLFTWMQICPLYVNATFLVCKSKDFDWILANNHLILKGKDKF